MKNIITEDLERIKLLFNYDNKKTLSENVNIINEQPSALAQEFKSMARAGSNELKTEIENLLLKTEIKTTSGIKLNTADEVINAFKAGKIVADDVKKITKEIINFSDNLDLRTLFIQKFVSTPKYKEIFSKSSKTEVEKILTDNGYKNVDEIIYQYEQNGGTFQKYSKLEKETTYKKEIESSKNTAQLVKDIDDLSNFIGEFKEKSGLSVLQQKGMTKRVQESKKMLQKIKENTSSIPKMSEGQLKSIEDAIRASDPKLWNYLQYGWKKFNSTNIFVRIISYMALLKVIGGAKAAEFTKFVGNYFEGSIKKFYNDFVAEYFSNGGSPQTPPSTPTPDKDLSKYDITVGDDGRPIYTLKK